MCELHVIGCKPCSTRIRFLQKAFAVRVSKMVIKEKEKSLKVEAGWYSEEGMRDMLGYSACLGFTNSLP